MNTLKILIFLTLGFSASACGSNQKPANDRVAELEGLVAFWDFETEQNGAYRSIYNAVDIQKSYPIYLRQIGDPNRYSSASWPYDEEMAALKIDRTGPFGYAIRFNLGYIYGEVPRNEFDQTSLDVGGENPFIIVAWVKFEGNRHMVAGIWDEGGWNRYAGRRQAALFAGLFNQKGVIAHISSTGAASFPQSSVDGSQYARIRAIDGQAFENGEWVAMAMTFDPQDNKVRAYLNGEMTASRVLDPVIEDVLQQEEIPLSNPLEFSVPIYLPSSFQLKFNGYDFKNSPLKEHFLWVDLNAKTVQYQITGATDGKQYRVEIDVLRDGSSLLRERIEVDVSGGDVLKLQTQYDFEYGDVVVTRLLALAGEQWIQVGTVLEHEYSEGAPFTFGRALGLDEDGIDHGSSELYVDGVAVYNRVLSLDELGAITFIP